VAQRFESVLSTIDVSTKGMVPLGQLIARAKKKADPSSAEKRPLSE
jgi:hypothetical protein